MKIASILAVSVILIAAPAAGVLIPVQEADEAANCELAGAGLVTATPEGRAIFPEDRGACRETDEDSREKSNGEGVHNDAVAGEADAVPMTEVAKLSHPLKQSSSLLDNVSRRADAVPSAK